jgi:plasmid maintenance system antidote protein VapI
MQSIKTGSNSADLSLHQRLSKLISEKGVDKAGELISVFTDGSINKSYGEIILQITCNYFKISSSELLISKGHAYSAMRGICFHILNRHMSIREIGSFFNLTENPVHRLIKNTDNIIHDPRLDKRIHKAYCSISLSFDQVLDLLSTEPVNKNSREFDTKAAFDSLRNQIKELVAGSESVLEICRLSGVSYKSLRDLLNGNNYASLEMILRLEHHFNTKFQINT